MNEEELFKLLAKIKVLIKKHYEYIGREEVFDVDDLREELIDEIEETVKSVKIPEKYIIAEDLDY